MTSCREPLSSDGIGQRLITLAEQNRPVAEARTLLAKAVRNSTALFEVVVALPMHPENDVEKSSN
jgi:hypothetical protein